MNFIASQALARSQQQPAEEIQGGDEQVEDGKQADAMAALERQARAPIGFVAASNGPEGGNIPPPSQPAVPVNPDALDVDLDDD